MASTSTILKAIVDHLARRDAPVDVKEVAESVEFYLRCGKRLVGAAKRVLKNEKFKKNNRDGDNGESGGAENAILIQDFCSGHGLTGMLFVAGNPPRGKSSEVPVRTVLVDRFEPRSHSILKECISEICPWVSQDNDAVRFVASPLKDYIAQAMDGRNMEVDGFANASVVVSTHACGSLTDDVLQYAMDSQAASVAVMPCCYTGTDAGAPYGVRRVLGVGLSADIRRSFYLQSNGYHVDFAAIPKTITPMNRVIVAERRS